MMGGLSRGCPTFDHYSIAVAISKNLVRQQAWRTQSGIVAGEYDFADLIPQASPTSTTEVDQIMAKT